jgi:hypothetical protein
MIFFILHQRDNTIALRHSISPRSFIAKLPKDWVVVHEQVGGRAELAALKAQFLGLRRPDDTYQIAGSLRRFLGGQSILKLSIKNEASADAIRPQP